MRKKGVEEAGQEAAADQNLAKKIAKTQKQLDALIATSGKCSEDRDCTALPLGEKACGGPEKYIVYSKRSPKSSEINALAATYLSQRQMENGKSIDMSDCEFVTAPKAKCNSKKSCEAMGK